MCRNSGTGGTAEKPRRKPTKALIRLDFYIFIIPHRRQNYNHFLREAEGKSAQIFEVCALFVRFVRQRKGRDFSRPKVLQVQQLLFLCVKFFLRDNSAVKQFFVCL